LTSAVLNLRAGTLRSNKMSSWGCQHMCRSRWYRSHLTSAKVRPVGSGRRKKW
jgi:hypothetical protein